MKCIVIKDIDSFGSSPLATRFSGLQWTVTQFVLDTINDLVSLGKMETLLSLKDIICQRKI